MVTTPLISREQLNVANMDYTFWNINFGNRKCKFIFSIMEFEFYFKSPSCKGGRMQDNFNKFMPFPPFLKAEFKSEG